MRNSVQRKIRSQVGFTVMELLAVVAVLVVIIAIAAPNLVVIARGAEINRLDNYAKEIYVALQDQFVGMETTNEYQQFNNTITAAGERNLGNLDAMPQDATNNEWRNYYFLTNYEFATGTEAGSADSALAQVMARTAVVEGLTRGSRYVVEVSPRPDGTDVYSVFYSEDPEFTYDTVRNLASRNQDDRRETGNGYPVGYYSGVAATGNSIPDSFRPRATFINGEELFLNIFCPGGMGLLGSESGITVKVTLTDGYATEILNLQGGTDFFLDANGNIDIDLVLDSLRPGMHLSDLAPSFIPGEDISATVDVTFVDFDGTTISTPAGMRAQSVANSLYASNSGGYVEVANVRHMANLNMLPANTTSVNQVADINFDASKWGNTEHTRLSSATRAYNVETYAVEYVNPLDPRTDPALSGFDPIRTEPGATWSFDGRGNKLSNFHIVGSGPTGLFAQIQADQIISNVTLVDTIVEGSSPAGTLVGRLFGRVENCGARLDITKEADQYKQALCMVNVAGVSPVGGLVGEAGGPAVIERSFAAVDVAGMNSNFVGGLVGSFAGTAVSTSYASGVLDGARTVGGLIGVTTNSAVQDCYSTSDINSAALAGGLVGSANGGSIWTCSAYGRVSVSGSGAFVGESSGVDFQDCTYLVQDAYNDGLAAQPAGVVGHDLATLAAPRLASDHSHPYLMRLMGSVFPFRPVLDDHWGNWPDPSAMRPTLLYYERYADNSYGYYGVGYDESGEVPFNTLDETMPVAEDGYALLMPYKVTGFSYSFNGGSETRATLGTAPGTNTFMELPTRADPTQYATESEGEYEEAPNYYLYYWQGDAIVPLENYHIYQLPFDVQMPSREAGSFYDLLEVTLAEADGTSAGYYAFYYNPDLAKTALSPNSSGETEVPGNPSELHIRTARQLNRIGHQPLYWASTIKQDRHIDFRYYDTSYLGTTIDLMATSGTYANVPIGIVGQPFTGMFDGGNYVIVDYCQDASGHVAGGMFGCVSGTVRNVHMQAFARGMASVSRTGSAATNYATCVGALAGWLDGGTVEGCSVAGYNVTLSSSTTVSTAMAGGLVGYNGGSVVRSTAANTTVANNMPSSSGAVLGIAGLVGGSSGAVHSNYAVENNLSCSTTTSGSGRTVSYGGIVGAAFEGSPEVGNCYAWAYATQTTCAAEDVVGYFAIADPSLITIFRCYALDTGEEYQDTEAITMCDAGALQNASLSDMSGGLSARSTYGENRWGFVVTQANVYPYPVVCYDSFGDRAHYGFDWRE